MYSFKTQWLKPGDAYNYCKKLKDQDLYFYPPVLTPLTFVGLINKLDRLSHTVYMHNKSTQYDIVIDMNQLKTQHTGLASIIKRIGDTGERNSLIIIL